MYIFKYKKSSAFFWKKEKIIGHGYDEKQDKMILYFQDGSLKEIASWKNHEVFLGIDWVLYTKNRLEAQTGQNIKLDTK